MSEPTNLQSDALSDRDLDGISSAVASGILRAANEQDPEEHRKRALVGVGYIFAALFLVGLVLWGWWHTPSQTVVLNASFLPDAKITAVLTQEDAPSSQPSSFRLRLDGVEEISRLHNSLMPVELTLPLDGGEIDKSLEKIETLQFGLLGDDSKSAPVSVSISATDIQQISLSRPSQGGQGAAKIDVETFGSRLNESKLKIIILPESNRTVSILAVDGSKTLPMSNGETTLDLPAKQLHESFSTQELAGTTIRTNTGSEFPGIDFEARVSKMTLTGTEGFFDVGQKRIPLVSDDELELILVEGNSFGVKMIDGKINLGSAAVATSVTRQGSQLLGRQIQVSPFYRTIVAGYGAALLGLFSSVLPALWSVITLLRRYFVKTLLSGKN
jgi:hypothetical protein